MWVGLFDEFHRFHFLKVTKEIESLIVTSLITYLPELVGLFDGHGRRGCYSSKSVYSDAMEARVCLHPNTIVLFGDIITQYNTWHCYVTEKHQVEVVEIEFPQTQD